MSLASIESVLGRMKPARVESGCAIEPYGADREVSLMFRNLSLALLFILSLSWQLRAVPQMPRDYSGEPLTVKEVRQLEKTAVTVADHRQLAAYYRFQAQQSQKKLAEAEELLKKWYPMERASKVPDPYPHSIRLVNEYSAQVEKYSRLVAKHELEAEQLEACTTLVSSDPEKSR